MEFLLQTKLAAPVMREKLIARARLLQRLNNDLRLERGFQRRLTLVVAPAGYGKTTLVVSWLRVGGLSFAWLSLDERDNDPALFLAYLLAALSSLGVGERARNAMSLPQPPPPEAIIGILLNEMATWPQPIALVLDDYHSIHMASIHNLMSFFIEHLPEQIHLVVVSREDPLLPVPRWRARGQTLELRQEELRFTGQETHQFLTEVMELKLDKDEINILDQRTEGWIAGLQLAGLAMQGLASRSELEVKGFIQDFAGSSRFVLDYLMSEVFQQQSAERQEFLLKTAILERMCGPLCNELTGHENSQVLLEELERANLFLIPLDQEERWFRYHHLFAEFLRHRLRVQDRAQTAELHLCASRWYERQGFITEAIEHAFSANDWNQAGKLVVAAKDGMLRRGEIASLLNDYRRLPTKLVESSPELALGYAWPLLLSGQYDRAEALMAEVTGVAAEGSSQQGDLYALRAYLARARGDHAEVIAASEKALALLGSSDQAVRGTLAVNLGIAYWHSGRLEETEQVMAEVQQTAAQTGNLYALLTASFFRARTLASRGRLRMAEGLYRQLLRESGQTPIAALVCFDLGTLELEWGRLDEAEQQVARGMELSARTGNDEFLSSGHILRSLIHLARKDFSAAEQEAGQASELARAYPPGVRARSDSLLVQIHLASGNLSEAERAAERMPASGEAHPLYRFLDLTQPRLLLAKGKGEEARELLISSCQKARQNGWGYGLLAGLVLMALAARTAGETADALREALEIGQPEGFLRTFTEVGTGLAAGLKEAARRGIQPEYVGQILAATGGPETARPAEGLIEGLSQREVEVLRLVAAGLTNREIARELVVSVGTAKTHIHNICGKLGVRNRMEAAVRARELKLI